MSVLADRYMVKFPEARRHGDSINGPCPFCGGKDRCVVWPDRGDGLGKTCTEQHIPGVFWCRQCGKGGDSLAWLMEAEGMPFVDACSELGFGLKPSARRHRPAPSEPAREVRRPFTPRETELPDPEWRTHVLRMDQEAKAALPGCRAAQDWLAARGISLEMAMRYGLGFYPGENGKPLRFRSRSSFGLPPRQGQDGRMKTKIALMRGVTIPSYMGGQPVMWRVRRPNGDLKPGDPKYWELAGGGRCMYQLSPAEAERVKAVIVVEAELDACLLHAVAGGSVRVIATRSSGNRPDAAAHEALSRADFVLLALDSDKAGNSGVRWWLDQYGKAVFQPIPGFKDPGDAFRGGFDLRLWLEASLPRTLSMAPSFAPGHGGRLEASSRQEGFCGEGEPERRGDGDEALAAMLPGYLTPSDIPEAVRAMAALWRRTPAVYVKADDGGFEWQISWQWRRAYPERFSAFMDAVEAPGAAQWLGDHVARVITARNVLHVFG